ncbi:MAG: response regulator transcription factor, partial [Bacteroidota bacterium]|nr:response regulator transcription factor [Bacteroidota bacterium]MDX5430245.1 response regulator transcription factor [Bacteroidota bacterium]MDX5469006.1 response regulator transcription factor [Bacteroidota bacterium]
QKWPDIKIMVLTMHQSSDVIFPLKNMGIPSIMVKNSGKAELLKGMQHLMEGKTYYSPEIMGVLQQKEQEPEVIFTRREKEILELLYAGLSTQDMAEKLFLSPHTVETHRRNMLSKTQTKNAPQLVRLALEKGWLKLNPLL